MSARNRTIGENLERLELSKLKKKYEALDYDFVVESRRKGFVLDAYAYKSEPRDEIIFEVKAIASLSVDQQRRILSERRSAIKQAFPSARFVLVIAKESEESEIVESPTMNSLMANHLSEQYFDELRAKIPNIRRPLKVEELSLERADFKDFSTIEIVGYGNLRFYLDVDTEEFRGTRLADGITFKFEVSLLHTNNPEQIYSIANGSQFYFDFAEFERNRE